MNELLVVEIHRLQGAGNLKGYATVRCGELEIHGCRIIGQPGQKLYVAWPQVDRGDQFFPVIRSPVEVRKRMEDLVLAEWNK